MLESNQFFRDMVNNNPMLHRMTQEEVEAVQKVLLQIMDDIDAVCSKYGLTYFLCGGSAIGALRHGGFIPWDDDIDLTMPRRDYDMLGTYIQKEFPDRYWVQNVSTDEAYDLSFMKIRKKGTRYVEPLDPEEEKAGVFIDIFPLEDVYEQPIMRKLHGYIGEGYLLICSCLRLRGKQKKILPFLKNPEAIRMVKKKARIGGFFSFRSLHKWLMATEKVLTRCRNEKSSYISIPSGRMHYFTEMYTRSSFFPPKRVDFEGHSYLIMNQPEEYLTKMYGDFMQIPPENKRETHALLELEV